MANEKNEPGAGVSRREFLKTTGTAGALLALGPGIVEGGTNPAPRAAAASGAGSPGGGYNILFILTDQERYFHPAEYPDGYLLPGRERLRREGVSFSNHQIASAVCTSSRSVIYTGQHIQHTGMFDNMGFPWSKELSTDTPTVGNRLQSAGYHAAYLGKWHMSEAMEDIELRNVPDVNMAKLNQVMQEHGFQDYVGVGDIIGLTLGGYRTDEFTASTAVRWLRAEPPKLAEKDKPWFLAVNFVNPHDVMFYNTDAPGETAQQDDKHAMPINRDPVHALYQRRWDVALPESRKEAWDYPGRPRAHYEYQYARQALVGQFPNEDARWRRLQNYYLNCNADCDRHVERLLVELDDLGLADNTIVIMTSDHGELGGAHGMHGKGATAYKEQNHVPLWIKHPAHGRNAGKESRAVTSHLDLAPTILGLAGVDAEKRSSLAPEMKGHDLSGLLAAPELTDTHAVRDDALYNMNMWVYQDSEFLNQVVAAQLAGKDVKSMGLKLDLTKRGAIRSINTGSYRYTRYFSPLQHNLPKTLEEIFGYNDVELFDLEADPNEMNNLAVDRKKNGELLLAMNEQMTRLINDEVGDDDGQFLPENKAGWAVTNFDP